MTTDNVWKGIFVGCAIAAVLASLSTAALRWAWHTRYFFAVWAFGFLFRLVVVGATAFWILRHSQLNFVATMASLIGFTLVFTVVESLTCLKKG